MGTSMSSQGSKSNSPLLPPWAAPSSNDGDSAQASNSDNETSSEVPPLVNSSRFQGFRQSLGNYVNGGGTSDAHKALKHYAKTSTGGGTTAKKRLSTSINAGASLVSFLSGYSSINSYRPDQVRTIFIRDLNGKSVDYVIDELCTGLTPDNGDGEKIRNALNESLGRALEGVELFDESVITPDFLSNLLVNFLSETVFEFIVLEGKDAWKKASSPKVRLEKEKELRGLIIATVQIKMLGNITADLNTLSTDMIKSIQDQTITEVWNEWEAYNE